MRHPPHFYLTVFVPQIYVSTYAGKIFGSFASRLSSEFLGRGGNGTRSLPLCCSLQLTPTDPLNQTAEDVARSKNYSPVGLPRGELSFIPSDFIFRNAGVLRPGEMVLVLDAPGSGCTTFPKVTANERGTYFNATDNVRYAGISHSEMVKHCNGEVAYNWQEGRGTTYRNMRHSTSCLEGDTHIPTLTVGQTLSFDLSMKAPGSGGHLPGASGEDFSAQVRDLLL